MTVLLPESVRRAFLSPETFSSYHRLSGEFGFEASLIPTLSATVYHFVLGTFSAEQLRQRLLELTHLSGPRLEELAVAIGQQILSPITKEWPQMQEKISVLGASIDSSFEAVTPMAFIRRFISEFPDTLDLHLQHRLENLLLDYVQGERSKEDVTAFLQRPFKLGGLEIDEATAARMIELFDKKRERIMIEPKVSVEQMVKQICADPLFQFTDPLVQKRCVEIVTARVRQVRDAIQTRAMLERPRDEGGLGILGGPLAQMLERMERAVDAAEREKKKELEEQRNAQRTQKEEGKREKEILTEKEEHLLAKRFVQTTGKIPTERIAPAAPTLARASAAQSAQSQLQQQEARMDAEKIRATVQQTVKSEAAPIPKSRPKVQDVQFERRLTGPIEELRAMSLVEFRRLSSDPAQAIARITDRIGLLEDQGYSKRVEGLQALRQSPLMGLYASLTQQALLSGTTVDAVISGQKDKQGLKKSEYEALMKLNAELRF